MNDEIREQLSALADDELSDAERPLLLGRLQRDPALRACLGRYELIGEVMRGAGDAAALGVAERVRKALDDELPLTATARGRAGWLKPVAGLAVAASVALVAVLAVNTLHKPGGEAATALASAGPAAGTPAVVAGVDNPEGEQWDRLDPSVDKRLAGYLVNHNEYAASRGVQGVMPYVRIVGYDTGE